ncbi:zinc-dependent metalloprotease family protein [Thalassotalea fusca]
MRLYLFVLTLLLPLVAHASQSIQLYKVAKKIDNKTFEIQLSKQVHSLAQQKALSINVPEFGDINFQQVRSYITNKNQNVWIGEGGNNSSITLVKSKHGTSGSIRTQEGMWLLRPSANSQTVLEKFDKSEFQASTDVLPTNIDEFYGSRKGVKQDRSNQSSIASASYNSTGMQTIQTELPNGFTENSDVRILVYYSSDAINDYPNLEDLVEIDFADANQALVNSNIDATYTLAGFIEIEDVGTEHNLYDMLYRTGNFERMDEMREKYDADLVHFYGGNVGWVCGVAFYTTDSTGWNESRYAVGATVPNCAGTLTFAHEIGHNLGARHDRYVEDGGTEDFAYGFVDTENRFRTLMSYTDKCNDNNISCTEITHYSNPNVEYEGNPSGIANEDLQAANNSFLLNETAAVAANYNGVGYPHNFHVSKGSASQRVELTWEDVPNADGYEIKRRFLNETCPDFHDVYESFETTTSNYLQIENHTALQYCYWVRAYKDYDHGARVYSAPTLAEVGYPSEVSIHVSDIAPQHIKDQNAVITIPFTTSVATTVSASIVKENASNWLTVNVETVGENSYQLTIVNTKEISASAIIVVNAGNTKEIVPVQFSGYSNNPPEIQIDEVFSIPQGESGSIEFNVSDDAGTDDLIVKAYSENESFISNKNISITGNNLTVDLEHNLHGSSSIIVTAFDGELLTSKRVVIEIDRRIYNAPKVPEELTLYVDGSKPLTRLLPGYSIDGDELAFELTQMPLFGSISIEGDSFTYVSTNDGHEDSFVITSRLVANGDENMPSDVYRTDVTIKPLPHLQAEHQQYIFGHNQLRLLLTHRGQIWGWGSKFAANGEPEDIKEPTLLLEGDWVSAAQLNRSVILLKSDGTLWKVDESWFLGNETSQGEYAWEPKQIGTDRDWVAIFESVGDVSYSGNIVGVALRKADGSLWSIGDSRPWNWDLDSFDWEKLENEPIQLNALYDWDSSTRLKGLTLYLNDSGKVWSMGSNTRSLGRARSNGEMAPVSIPEKVTRVSGDLWRGYANTESGLYVWGTGIFIDGEFADYSLPTLLNEQKWLDYSSSPGGFAAVTENGELYTSSLKYNTYILGRGEGAYNALSIVNSDAKWVDTYSVDYATYALKDDGTLWVAGKSMDYYPYILGLGEELNSVFNEFTHVDKLPADIFGVNDTDGDGILDFRDNNDDNDCLIDSVDPEPEVENVCIDTDGDGIVNEIDYDDDNDGVKDSSDAFPLDASESVDTDSDGIGNNADTDDDNDGIDDSSDAFPLDASESVDTDGDGIGNNADSDDDNDGVVDSNDAYPLDASRSTLPAVESSSNSAGGGGSTDRIVLVLLLVTMVIRLFKSKAK